ncbi:septum-promoting GTP-binding protein 1-like isoform X2 [Diospyros lotus]|uniref:septum-promoting GTP-binding protein 1-like isoform X2 n=1 Tax=Diospyros lotus TaxID=55363 RepID=UPI00224DAAE1|nr:septum-promoting GTP-binding protein 1-like isoform X2 [Diospyros lotus]
MTAKPRRQMFPLSLRRRVVRRVSLLRRRLRSLWRLVLACTMLRKSTRYRQLPGTSSSSTSPAACDVDSDQHCRDSSDLVALKISLLGDCQIGKTSFLTKYVGKEREEEPERRGLNQMVKTLSIGGARIAYSVWEVSGDEASHNHIPAACKDSVAILIMFDLTSRCTLNSVIRWYQDARKWNQTAIPVLIGTKFDDFVKLPVDLQWTIANQANE